MEVDDGGETANLRTRVRQLELEAVNEMRNHNDTVAFLQADLAKANGACYQCVSVHCV